jgi:hypothetical protein
MYLISSSYDITVEYGSIRPKVDTRLRTDMGATLIRVTWVTWYQATLKTRYCGRLYSSLIRLRTGWGHRVYISLYVGRLRIHTSLTRTHLCFLHSTLLKVSFQPCHSCALLLRFRLWALPTRGSPCAFDKRTKGNQYTALKRATHTTCQVDTLGNPACTLDGL